MRLTENELNNIIREEFTNLLREGEIDEKLFDKLKRSKLLKQHQYQLLNNP